MDRQTRRARAARSARRPGHNLTHRRQRAEEPGHVSASGRWAGPDALGLFTGLPLERAFAALSDYDVRSVVVASDGHAWREHLLAVTSEGLAILTPPARGEGKDDAWAISVAHWRLVRLGELSETPAEVDGSRFDLVVRVGRRTFVALLDGPSGQRVLRDFVVAVQKGVRGDFTYLDYDAASMLTH